MRVVEVTRTHDARLIGSYVISANEANKVIYEELRQLIEESADGESLGFCVYEMSESEYEATPEFSGW